MNGNSQIEMDTGPKLNKWGSSKQCWNFRNKKRQYLKDNFYDKIAIALYDIQVNLGLNSIKCNNVFNNKIQPLHVLVNDGHHRR
jgi:hypothetical protein